MENEREKAVEGEKAVSKRSEPLKGLGGSGEGGF